MVLLLSACSTSKTKYITISNLSERIKTPAYSVLPPQEKGWAYNRETPIKLVFGRQNSKNDQSYVGFVVVSRLIKVNSKEEYFDFVTSQRNRDIGNPRYEDISNEENVELIENNYVFRFHKKFKDFGAKNLPKSAKYLVIEDYGATYQHPLKENYAVTIALSQRTLPSGMVNSFHILAKEFVDSIQFYDFDE